ncbi:uncharacterized protein STEHIDRAFT_172549 [Stereum hirsutum FP-91666 SS1]|uniref:uncharacterized protein n=1 Tax=Stereum hirsutum (strain FP-91666) TaxID=721885 RepID=UPI0004449DD4|nr:uncharacterized protein STEHIDRAFT_172549 [Stereum hirsutum FP-91666 SS1]EIM80880.1 hypothetical protein STEHIDRAFT_172549 [Stereum hirsutum FP-91666 SS1]
MSTIADSTVQWVQTNTCAPLQRLVLNDGTCCTRWRLDPELWNFHWPFRSECIHLNPSFLEIWWAQAHHLLAAHSPFKSLAEFELLRECYFTLDCRPYLPVAPWDQDFAYCLQNTFMADVPPFNDSPVYIFLQDLVVSPAKHQLCFPGMFWAWDPEGDQRLSDEEVDMHFAQFGSTLQDLTLKAYCQYSAKWKQYHYDLIREVHQRLGFNPDTREVAEFMGYPPIEIDTEALAALNFSRVVEVSDDFSSSSTVNPTLSYAESISMVDDDAELAHMESAAESPSSTLPSEPHPEISNEPDHNSSVVSARTISPPQAPAGTRPVEALLVIPYPTPAVTSAITFILGVALALLVSFYLQGGRGHD